MSGLDARKRRFRFKSMIWTLAFIVIAAVGLPTASVFLAGDSGTLLTSDAMAQVNDGNNQRSNFWRAVRQGNDG